MLRLTTKQRDRCNVPVDNALLYFKRAYFSPFIDTCIAQLNASVVKQLQPASSALCCRLTSTPVNLQISKCTGVSTGRRGGCISHISAPRPPYMLKCAPCVRHGPSPTFQTVDMRLSKRLLSCTVIFRRMAVLSISKRSKCPGRNTGSDSLHP